MCLYFTCFECASCWGFSKNKCNVLLGMNNVKMKEVNPQLDFSENLKMLDFSYCCGAPAIRTSMF